MTDQRLKSSEDQAHSSGPVTVVTDEANCGVNQKRLLCCWHVVHAWRFDSLMDRLRRGDCVNFVPLSVRYFVYWLPILHSNYWPVVRRSSASVHRLNREFVLEAALFLGGGHSLPLNGQASRAVFWAERWRNDYIWRRNLAQVFR